MLVRGSGVWSGWLALAGAILMGCGGRTSMLDADVYANGEGGSGGAVGGGGRGGVGSGGKVGSGIDPSASVPACNAYCEGYEVTCASQLGNRDCRATCASEISTSPTCQKRGMSVLKCLAPHYRSRPGLTCSSAEAAGTSACSKQLRAFEDCAPPAPDRPVDLATCSVDGFDVGTDCFRSYSCPSAGYVVLCSNRNCDCTLADGSIIRTQVAPAVTDVCGTGAVQCGLL